MQILIGSAAGGCCFAVGDGADAAVFWDLAVHPAVLVAAAEPAVSASEDTFDLRRFETLATVLRQPDGTEHVLLSDGHRRIQIALAQGTVLQGTVRLHYRLSGFTGVEAGVLTLRRFCGLHSLGRLPCGLFAAESRSPRFLTLLRAYDGWREGLPTATSPLCCSVAKPSGRIGAGVPIICGCGCNGCCAAPGSYWPAVTGSCCYEGAKRRPARH